MVPALAFLLLAADPAARLDAYLKARPSFVASVTMVSEGKTVGTGTLRLARPRRLRFDVKGSGFDYSVVSTEATYLEIERTQKTYDERPSMGGMRLYEARVSGARPLLPNFLLAPSAKGMFGGLPVTAVGDDELRATAQTETGPVALRALVDAQGRPTLFSTKGTDGFREWRVTAFAPSPEDAPAYRLEAPLGYVPYALPDLPYPLQIGESAPLTGWRKGGRAVDLNEPQRGKPRLLAVLGADCAPSRAARPFLIDLGRTMPVFLLEKGGVVDPSGALMRRLSPPGTPMFYLVGVDGTVKKLWFGFDKAKGAAWEAEVRAAAAEKAKA